MNRSWQPCVLALAVWLGVAIAPAFSQSMAPAFSSSYHVVVLGAVTNLAGPYGGLIFSATDPDQLLIGGASATAGGQLYAVPVQRDASGHIVGFQGPATVRASAPFNDGGLAYASNGVLLVAQSTNAVGELKPGSTALDFVVGLHALGVTNSPGGLNFVPAGFPGAGGLKILSSADAEFYGATSGPDGNGTLAISGVRSEAQLPYYAAFFSTYSRQPEAFLYLPPGQPGFTDYTTLLVCETDSGSGMIGSGVVAAYQLDANGAPVPATRQAFVTGVEPKGIAMDPLTGDLLISSYSPSLFIGVNSLIAVRGGAPPPTRIISLGGDLAFGNVAVGSSAQRSLTISNSGNATLTISNLSFPSGFSGDWLAGSIPAGAVQSVTVTFAPTAVTNYGGMITASSDATSGVSGHAVSGAGTGVGPVLALSSTLITNDYTGLLQLQVSGVTPGQAVVVETFLDISNTGNIDPGDPLFQSFRVTDGAAPVLAGVTNVNIPFDLDGATNGQVTIAFPLRGDFGMDRMPGSYVIRVSDPAGGFAPVVTSLRIAPATYPQGVAGTLLDSTTANPVSGAVVALVNLASAFGASGTLDLSQTHLVGSSFTDSQGRYTDYCPPGYYLALALRVGYYSVLPVNDFVALFSALIQVQANQWTAHSATVTPGNLSISGALSGNPGGGLPGVMLFAIGQATNGLEFAFGFTDAQGRFQMPVGAGQWSLMLPPLALARLGCVTVTNLPVIDTSTGSVSGLNLVVPAATNLIYGHLAGAAGVPLGGVRIEAVSLTDTNDYTATDTDANGLFVLGVVGGNWLLRPDAKTIDGLGYEQPLVTVAVSNAPVVLANIVVQPIPPPDPGALAWHWQNPLPQGNNLAGVAVGNGVFVAVGDHGTVLRSEDGRQWTLEESGTIVPLNAVTYANGLFVAVGGQSGSGMDTGLVLVSTNGVAWRTADPGASGVLQAIAYGQNTFVAVGEGGVNGSGIVTSSDGLHWQPQSAASSSWLRAVAFGNGRFVAGGDSGVILASTDAGHWNNALPGSTNFVTSAAFANGQFVLGLGNAGHVLASTNGVNWNSQPTDVYASFALLGSQGQFWRVSGSSISTSTDGSNWLDQPLLPPVSGFALTAITAAPGAFVAVGGAGAIAYSPDGTNWVAESAGATRSLNDVAFGAGRFVAADSQAQLLSSLDGSSWTTVYAGNRLGNAQFARVFYAGGMFFATGNTGNALSQDGQHWGPDDLLGAVAPNAMTYVNGTIYAVGSHGLFTSRDGWHWLASSPAMTNNLNAIAFGNGTFVTTDGSTLWASSDGVAWSATFDASALQIYALQNLVFANGRFVAADPDSGVLVSNDGSNWTTAIVPPAGRIEQVAVAAGTFVAVGDNISASADGLH
ncbi:MAG: choice-of-anchor D domain-containing protein, partial [Verrucomicrobia bacterium]|nr:choice-of-anchor D domain-containing protein [Verrucomicrobiota bacterium]